MQVDIADLREQAINAQVMPPREFERLVANIKERGALESLPYCAWPGEQGFIEIVSGHHRVRGGKAAGLHLIHVLVDTSPLTRSKIVAKQLAHNALVGRSDAAVVKELLGMIDTPEDLLASGVPEDLLPRAKTDAMLLFTPTMDVNWKTVSFTFLPHQLDNLNKLFQRLEGPQDLVVAALDSQWEKFLTAAAKVARIKEIRAGGTVVALLTEMALNEIARHEREQAEAGTGSEQPDTEAGANGTGNGTGELGAGARSEAA